MYSIVIILMVAYCNTRQYNFIVGAMSPLHVATLGLKVISCSIGLVPHAQYTVAPRSQSEALLF
jgi:hypothetical protein